MHTGTPKNHRPIIYIKVINIHFIYSQDNKKNFPPIVMCFIFQAWGNKLGRGCVFFSWQIVSLLILYLYKISLKLSLRHYDLY